MGMLTAGSSWGDRLLQKALNLLASYTEASPHSLNIWVNPDEKRIDILSMLVANV